MYYYRAEGGVTSINSVTETVADAKTIGLVTGDGAKIVDQNRIR